MGVLSDLRDQAVTDLGNLKQRLWTPGSGPTFPIPPSAPASPRLAAVGEPDFFYGQPVTSGPYTLAIGTPLTVQDPILFGLRSNKVQIQNATGLLIVVATGVGTFTIQPLTAATVPTGSGIACVINPVAGVTNFSENITLVWMLKGQNSPMQDGSLSPSPTPGVPLTLQITNFPTANGPSQALLLAAAPTGFSYLPYSLVFTSDAIYTTSVKLTVAPPSFLQTGVGGAVIYTFPTTFTPTIAYPPVASYSLTTTNALTSIGPVYMTLEGNAATGIDVTLNYFLVS